MSLKDKAARQKYSHAYYLAHREELIAYGKAYRDAHKVVRVCTTARWREMLRALAGEDGITVAQELRRLILRESFVRAMARGNHAQAMD